MRNDGYGTPGARYLRGKLRKYLGQRFEFRFLDDSTYLNFIRKLDKKVDDVDIGTPVYGNAIYAGIAKHPEIR